MRTSLLLTCFMLLGLGTVGAQQVAALQTDTLGEKHVIDILFEGNKRTKAQIMLREMTFEAGDKLLWSNLKAAMKQSQSNLMNLELFNFVEIEPLLLGNGEVMVLVTVQERWYIYPVPIFEIAETNFNTWWENKELRWLNYGVSLKHKNFRGLNQQVAIMARFGYTRRFSASYSIPNLNKAQTLGLNLAAGYFENNELVYRTIDNTRQFYNNPEDKARRWNEYRAGITYRENIFTRHTLTLSYHDVRVNDTIPILNMDYLPSPGARAQWLRASYMLSHDTRDYKRYPLKGMLLYAYFQQDGLGLVNQDGFSLFTTQLSYRHHHKVGERLYLAHALTGKVNWSEPPYYMVNALGYGNFVRGYELFVVDGTRFGLLQSNFKYEVIQPRTISLPFVPSQFGETFVALYANLFFDAGYVYGPLFSSANSLVNEYLYSMGVGLDLVTYYDKVVRVEGSLNALGQTAIFVHFNQAF